MYGVLINPYALYVHCDGAMDYDTKNSGGIGFEIIFPDSVELESIKKSIGRYGGANIERIELEAILQGMGELIRVFDKYNDKLKNVKTIIITTDRFGLNDDEKTNPYRIREWRKNGWYNYENKPIKNSDLLDKIDKTRRKIINKTFCSLEIKYQRRKFNKNADKLAKVGKKQIIKRGNISLWGIKIGKRNYEGDEISYTTLKESEEYVVHVFKKEPVRDQWEIDVEFCEGKFLGRKLKIYSDSALERKIHRRHAYRIKIKNVFTHHVAIFQTIKEIKITEGKI